jgi:muramoyltetrapeptide carboxypeptidase LdcA involved in peptidoglycan recycling
MPLDGRTRPSIAATSRAPSQSTFEDFETGIEEFHDLGSGVTFGVAVLRGDIDEARADAERLAEERG